jgi:thiol-disulfide isomerase/thioredoxin
MKHLRSNGVPRRERRAASALAALAAAAAILACLPAAAQPAADALLRDFVPTGDFVLEVEGQKAEGAEIYQTERVAAILVVTSKLAAPALLQPRAGTVETVSLMSLARRPDGTIDVLANAELAPAGRFTLEDENVRFSVGGKSALLKPKPYLLGLQDAGDLLADKPEYARGAREYRPYEPSVESLRAIERPVRVRVYFGSWCPACGRMVPPLLKVVEQLEGSNVGFEFYGLPQDFAGEPAAEADDVHSVPTGIVWVGGKEVGRLSSPEHWKLPESTLVEILNGGGRG